MKQGLTDSLSNRLDWLMPSLHRAESLRRNGDSAEAEKEATRVIRKNLKRAMLKLPRLDLCGELSKQAEKLLERRVVLLNKEIHLDNLVNWSRLANTDGQRNWHLGYMYWLNALSDAYDRTREERYAEQWRDYVEEFLDHCPYAADARGYWPTRPMVENDLKTCNLGENGGPRQDSAGPESRSQWMSLSCHFRMETWLSNLARLADSDSLDDTFLLRVIDSLLNEHAYVCVLNPRENTPNQFTAVTLSLLKLSLLLPEFRVSASYFLVAWERLKRVFSNTVLPDGSDLEQSPDYNAFLLDLGLEVLSLLQDAPASRQDLVKETVRKRLRFLTAILAPGNLQPPIGKAHYENKKEALLSAARSIEDSVSVEAIEQGSGSLRRSCSFPYGGYHCLRYDGNYLLFKNSAMGVGHMHEDCLSFILWADGKELLTDPSHYTYNTNTEEEAALNAYALGTQGHNAICIDGMGQRRLPLSKSGKHKDDEVPELFAASQSPLPFRACENADFSFLEGSYSDGFGPNGEVEVTHSRTLVAIRKSGWLIIDQFKGNLNGRSSQQHWHLASRFEEKDIRQSEPRELGTCSDKGGNFRIIRLDPIAPEAHLGRGEMNPPRGWVFPEYAVKAPAWELMWESKLDDQPWHAVWIEPLDNPSPPPISLQNGQSGIQWVNAKGESMELLINRGTFELGAGGKVLHWQESGGKDSRPPPSVMGIPLQNL